MIKPIYNKKDWILGQCQECYRFNYVEPHGTTAQCKCSKEWTEHKNIPYSYRDMSGLYANLPDQRKGRFLLV